MTQEQVEKAVEQTYLFGWPTWADKRRAEGFITGANWALSHQWISVEDELPEKDDIYLVLVNSKVPLLTTFNHNKGIFEPYRPYNITHWMPIPKLVEE